MRRAIVFCLLLLAMRSLAQTDTITQRIFLIGDAGEIFGPNGTQPVIDWLEKNVDWNDRRNSAVFLGDNVYPLGMPMKGELGYEDAKRVMDYLVKPFRGKQGKAFFIPGNHDWENGKLGGLQRVRNQNTYVNSLDSNIRFFPAEGGCPGPEFMDMSNQVAIVFVDSQWFLYIHDKPGPESTCGSRTVDEFTTQLKELAEENKNRLLLIVTHHPIYSFGVHGGNYTWKEWLFPLTALNKNLWIPLPVIGAIYPISRGVFGNLQDIKHPLYQDMADALRTALRDHPNAIIASGHEHNLQFIERTLRKDTIFQIISGAGAKLSRVKENREGKLLFEDVEHGFSLLEVHKSGKVVTKFYNMSSKDLSAPTFVHDMRTIEAPPAVISKDSIPVMPDSVMIAADPNLEHSSTRNLFLGKNYRNEWTTPVKVPVLNLGNELGGLTPTKQGGGKQTKSLRVTDSTGKEWALRSVAKFPEAAIPADLRETIVKDIVTQGVSASYPFGALSVEPLAKAAGVPYKRRKLVYIPDDPRLKRFRSTFKNTLAILEERVPENIKDKPDNTDEIVVKLAKDNDRHIDQVSVLKARLLDNFYMDFDRHEGQWDWASRDTGKGKVYYAIPKDQDQAFFTNQGILPYFARRPWLVPEIQGFEAEAKNINTFNRPARNFDRFFLNELSREEWSNQIDTFLSKMTDGVIEEALMRQPREIRGFHYDGLVKTLKERRKYFKKDMMKYYDFLSKEVNIVGTNQRELFVLDKLPDDRLHVAVNKIDKNGDIATKMYDRTFDRKETRQLQIYGLEGRDSFVVRGNEHTSIKVRLIGGPDEDWFVAESNVGKPVRTYDVSFEENHFGGTEAGFKKRIKADPQTNEYSRIFYRYGYFKPSVFATYNVDDGIFLGARGELLTHGFRKDPFSTQQIFRLTHALRTKAYFFNYDGIFTKAIGVNDIKVDANLWAPVNVTNFFGIGNNTSFDKDVPGGLQYYRARYSLGNLSVMLRRHLQSWMRINYGPTLQYFHVRQKENADKYIGSGPLDGVNLETLYDRKLYAGAQVLVDINSRNNPNLATRGLVLNAGVKQLFGLNSNSNALTQVHFDASILASFTSRAIAVYGARLGWYRNYGTFEVPQAQYLSGTENLRGFRRNRFAGRSAFFVNTEVRIKLAEFNTYLFPGYFGVLVFDDFGRVYAGDERSGRWHTGYGGGIWVAPIRRWVLTITGAHSIEEKLLPYVSVGFRF